MSTSQITKKSKAPIRKNKPFQLQLVGKMMMYLTGTDSTKVDTMVLILNFHETL